MTNRRSGSKKIKPPKIKTDIGALSMKFKGANLWNDLIIDLNKIPKIKKFRLKLKQSIMPYPSNKNKKQ